MCLSGYLDYTPYCSTVFPCYVSPCLTNSLSHSFSQAQGTRLAEAEADCGSNRIDPDARSVN
jgi:hypothetical protein